MVGFSDCFRDDPQSANYRHEIGIAQAARHAMSMDMIGLTGTGDTAVCCKISREIEIRN
jgi:hypothetical protein